MARVIRQLALLAMMVFIASCVGEKHMYMAGWEARFNGDERCRKFVTTQAVDKETAYTVYSAIELVFKNNKLVETYDIEEGNKSVRELRPGEAGFKYMNVKPNQLYEIRVADNSNSFLGGEPPPKLEFTAPFQYLGKFSKSDEAFSWLPFDLHLVAPFYLNVDKVFIDYSDPMKPKVLNVEQLSKTGNAYNDLKPNSEIVFKKVYIKEEKSKTYGYPLGHTGVPYWIQYPDIPTCPKSKKTMKFLCQLKSFGGIETERTNVQPANEGSRQYFNHMNFWGDLYIFFEPESKVACFIIQST